MATDRDKTITELCERYKDDDIDACEDLAREVWEATRADAIEECAPLVTAAGKLDEAMCQYHCGKLRYGQMRQFLYPPRKAYIAFRSLSRKQEEPR